MCACVCARARVFPTPRAAAVDCFLTRSTVNSGLFLNFCSLRITLESMLSLSKLIRSLISDGLLDEARGYMLQASGERQRERQ